MCHTISNIYALFRIYVNHVWIHKSRWTLRLCLNKRTLIKLFQNFANTCYTGALSVKIVTHVIIGKMKKKRCLETFLSKSNNLQEQAYEMCHVITPVAVMVSVVTVNNGRSVSVGFLLVARRDSAVNRLAKNSHYDDNLKITIYLWY